MLVTIGPEGNPIQVEVNEYNESALAQIKKSVSQLVDQYGNGSRGEAKVGSLDEMPIALPIMRKLAESDPGALLAAMNITGHSENNMTAYSKIGVYDPHVSGSHPQGKGWGGRPTSSQVLGGFFKSMVR